MIEFATIIDLHPNNETPFIRLFDGTIIDENLKLWESVVALNAAAQKLVDEAVIDERNKMLDEWVKRCDKAVEAEREACALIAESHVMKLNGLQMAAAIRARGQKIR